MEIRDMKLTNAKIAVNFFIVAVISLLAVDVMQLNKSPAIKVSLHGVDGEERCSEKKPFFVHISNTTNNVVESFYIDVDVIDVGTGRSLFGRVSLFGDLSLYPGKEKGICISAGKTISADEIKYLEAVDIITGNKKIGYLDN